VEEEEMTTYPIAEIFHSIQGEGFWTGTPMMFVRLAGCNVGRYETPSKAIDYSSHSYTDLNTMIFNNPKHSICTTFDGQRFLCDTDYHTSKKMTTEEIVGELAGEHHVCITGGEPAMHNLIPLLEAFKDQYCHIETSGTLPLNSNTISAWITCCPKHERGGIFFWNCIFEAADEWKFLVGPGFQVDLFESFLEKIPGGIPIYLQPINGVQEIWQENLNHCLELLKKYPQFKLSAQLHKYLGVR
jgi:7-carboxy-7-deazaguanine synthase